MQQLLRDNTWPAIREKKLHLEQNKEQSSLMSLDECSAVLVEPSSHFKKLLHTISEEYGSLQSNGLPRITIHHPVGISGCDSSKGLLFNNGPRKRSSHLGTSLSMYRWPHLT